VPRILVADDNSNIHRAVALALKEAGVEVVAVGNGEAAVRKIAEIKPDLVLADIFMPVRNGYEVCEFVKQDPRFSQVPVVLLIGAFDPFDEREAQRVRADAILKKPFMPPDSLMRTVTDLLAQTAARVAQASAAAAPAPQVERPAAPKPPIPAAAPEYMDEAPEDAAPAKAKIEWNASEQPVAFGTLLETPGAETEAATAEADAVLTSRRDPTLGEPAFWVPKAKQEQDDESGDSEAEESEETSSAELVDEEQLRSAGVLEELISATQVVPAVLQTQSRTAGLELPEVVSPANESAAAPVEASRKDSRLPAQLPELSELPELPELPALDLSSSVNRQIEPLPSPVSKAKIEERRNAVPAPAAEEQDALPDLNDFAWAKTDYSEAQTAAPQPEADEEIVSKSEDALIEAAKPGLATLAPFLASLTSAAAARGTESSESFELEPAPVFPSVSRTEPELESEEQDFAESLSVPATPQLDPAVIEAIAQRVIERMQPKIIELVTRELLRPAVEALVQRELERK